MLARNGSAIERTCDPFDVPRTLLHAPQPTWRCPRDTHTCFDAVRRQVEWLQCDAFFAAPGLSGTVNSVPMQAPANRAERLRRLRRVTTSGNFIPEIDGLRFVAITAVVLYHVHEYLREMVPTAAGRTADTWVSALIGHGHYGVQLFFVISGFILALPFASHHVRNTRPIPLRMYFLRRLTRLEPPYALSVLLFSVLLVVYVGQPLDQVVPHALASLFYVHNLVFGTGSLINAVAWSLEIEIQFYLLVPLFAQVFAIRSVMVRRGVLAGGILLAVSTQSAYGVLPDSQIGLTVLGHVQYFLTGFLLADVYLADWHSAPQRDGRWDLVSLAAWPVLFWSWQDMETARWLFPPLALLLYQAAFRGRLTQRLFSAPAITAIGGMCYTIYLLHYQVISFVGRFTITHLAASPEFLVVYAWQLLLMLPAVLLVSVVFFLMIERPCMHPDWPRRLSSRFRLGLLAPTTE